MPRRGWWIVGTLGLVLLALAGGWAVLLPQDALLQQVQSAGVLRIGYAVEAPYAMTGPAGEALGESPTVAAAVANRLGVRPEFVLMDFHELIPALEAGRIDLVAAGLFVTPERAQRVLFSRPTLRVRPGWLARAGRFDLPLTAPELVARAELHVAVVEGAVEASRLGAAGLPASRLRAFPDAASAAAAVRAGTADVLALSWPTVVAMAARSGGRLQAWPAQFPGEDASLTALAVRRGEHQLLAAVDEALAGHLGSPAHLAALAAVGLGPDDLPVATRPDARH